MEFDFRKLAEMSDQELQNLAATDPAAFQSLLDVFTGAVSEDKQRNQLAYYTVANPMALPVHLSTAREVAIVGGNRSSKTDTMLAELSIQMTGVIPTSLRGLYPTAKLRPPIRARIVCNSLTDTLEPVIKPKLRWDQWNGVGTPDEGRGHWGWIPANLLKDGKWESAYSDKYRTLYVGVDTFWNSPGGGVSRQKTWSMCQFLSYDQDLSAFAGSSMHFVGHDELPPEDIYRENRMRTLDVKGQIYTAFTPPDEAGASRGDVSYFFDEVYERGLPGPDRDPSVETIILHTEANRILDPADVQAVASRLTDAQREVRLHGRFVHLSGVIFSEFTARDLEWCFRCSRRVVSVGRTCPHCTGDDLETYCHVIEPFDVPTEWPLVYVVDPHPRKPDAMAWFAISPSDTAFVIAEAEIDGTAQDVAHEVQSIERRLGGLVTRRLMDPNIATETNDKMQRGWTLHKAYADVGLNCSLAVDNMNVGIQRVNEALRPEKALRRPSFAVFSNCQKVAKSMQRWSWDEHRNTNDREAKEKPRDKWKDFCDVVRYFWNDLPNYDKYRHGAQVYRRPR